MNQQPLNVRWRTPIFGGSLIAVVIAGGDADRSAAALIAVGTLLIIGSVWYTVADALQVIE